MDCPYCGKEAPWVSNELRYGRRFGKSYMCYWCKGCDAYVGCHHNTRIALGTMANAELRAWRMKAHAAIDPLWKTGRLSRNDVYQKLHKWFGHEVHVGSSDVAQCQAIIKAGEALTERYKLPARFI